ncbi:hypothetical protein IG631_03361 [Alternaria alternata]|nr:hypothetical protein IG631_03361 [Alternaria alternata]
MMRASTSVASPALIMNLQACTCLLPRNLSLSLTTHSATRIIQFLYQIDQTGERVSLVARQKVFECDLCSAKVEAEVTCSGVGGFKTGILVSGNDGPGLLRVTGGA